jgi:hypothetical protein
MGALALFSVRLPKVSPPRGGKNLAGTLLAETLCAVGERASLGCWKGEAGTGHGHHPLPTQLMAMPADRRKRAESMAA